MRFWQCIGRGNERNSIRATTEDIWYDHASGTRGQRKVDKPNDRMDVRVIVGDLKYRWPAHRCMRNGVLPMGQTRSPHIVLVDPENVLIH